VALRYFNVFGPRQDPLSQYAAVIPNFITGALEGQELTVYGDGEQSRDFTHVDNVIDANLRAMTATGIAGRTYNIACGERITLNRLIGEIGELLGTTVRPAYAAPRPGDVRHSVADITRAREDLGYSPVVGFREGIERTLTHFRDSSRPELAVQPHA
jgi:nucleoside-diphosphate-sugar epimerase